MKPAVLRLSSLEEGHAVGGIDFTFSNK